MVKRKRRKKYYYVFRSAANGEFIDKEKFDKADPRTVYKERRVR